jgi:hypothetical protein
MQALRCPHCGRCLGAIAIITIVALASLRTLPWRSCAPPLHGRRHPPLGPWPFCHLPSAIGTRPGLCPFVVHSSESISLIALALAPALTALVPAFVVDGACPLVSAFLADLRACSTPSKAGSSLSSETLPALFFCQLSRFQAALFCFWGVTTPASPMPAPASACGAP